MDHKILIAALNHVVFSSANTYVKKFSNESKKKSFFKVWLKWLKESQMLASKKHPDMDFFKDVSSKDADSNEWAQDAYDYIQDAFDTFVKNFTHNSEIVGNKLVVQRCISISNPKQFLNNLRKNKKPKPLGIYWSWKQGGCYDAAGAGFPIIVVGQVPTTSINWPITLAKNLHPYIGSTEAEIELKKGAPIMLTGATDRPMKFDEYGNEIFDPEFWFDFNEEEASIDDIQPDEVWWGNINGTA